MAVSLRIHFDLRHLSMRSRTIAGCIFWGPAPDGVHSDQEHCYALLELAKRVNFPGNRVFVHAITDGRDTAPQSGIRFLAALEAKTKEMGIGSIATVCGRYYMMDLHRWECGEGL